MWTDEPGSICTRIKQSAEKVLSVYIANNHIPVVMKELSFTLNTFSDE